MALRNVVAYNVNRALRPLGLRLGVDRPLRDAPRLLLLKAAEAGVETILDIGANTGQFGAHLRREGYAGRIVSFEPLSEAHAKLTARASSDPAWVVAAPMALGSKAGSSWINVSEQSTSSSLLQVENASVAVAPASAFVGTEQIDVRRLDDEVQDEWSSTLAIKIDTQGFELEVLKGGEHTLRRTAVIMVEMSLVSLYRGGPKLPEVYSHLEEAGFRCIALAEGFADPRANEVLQVDGVFVRDSHAVPAKPA